MDRPTEGEFAPFYEPYIEKLPTSGDLLDHLETTHFATQQLLRQIPSHRGDYRYAPDKWTIKQLIQHLIDTEQIMAYRALRIARGDKTALPGFDENAYVAAHPLTHLNLTQLLDSYQTFRQASLFLFRSFHPSTYRLTASASDSMVSVRALAGIILGHELHHRSVLEERYLSQF